MTTTIKRLLGGISIVLLSACGGGGSSSVAPGPAVARVEVLPDAVLLTGTSDTKQLSAKAFDRDGNEVRIGITWRSSRPDAIAVDASGRVSVARDNASSQITAEAGGVKSAPLLAVATTLPVGTITLTDAQIVGDPVDTDADAAPSFANTYQVVLSGIAAPGVGALLVNTESKPVAGRVVAVASAGGQSTVTLQLVPLRQMFPNMTIDEQIDLSRAQVVIHPDIAASYDVQRSGNAFAFTPRPVSGASSGRVRPMAQGTAARPPFAQCEFDITGAGSLPLQLAVPPTFSATQNFGIDLVYTAASGLERFVVRGEITQRVEIGLSITAAFEGSVTCEQELFALRIPVGGPLSLFVSGLIPVKAGFEAGGKFTLATAGIGLKAETKASAELGLACPGGANCGLVRDFSGEASATPVLDAPSLADIRFEPSLTAFGKVELAIGNPLLRGLRFEAVEAQAGPALKGSFAPQASQVADTGYKSDYRVSVETRAGIGPKLDDALQLLGLPEILSIVEITRSVDIAKSPTGVVTADRDEFAQGETVNFRVLLDANSVSFFPLIGPYNVKQVLLLRLRPGATFPSEVARLSAASGQTQFDFAFSAPDAGSAGEFSAFLVSALLPLDLFALEVGQATSAAAGLRVTVSVPSPIATSNGQGTATVTVTVERANASGGFDAVPNFFVSLGVSCGTLASNTGQTDAAGRFSTTLTVSSGCASVALTAAARASANGPVLKQQSATAAVTSSVALPDMNGTYRVAARETSLQRCGEAMGVGGTAIVSMTGDQVTVAWTIDTLTTPDSARCLHSTLFARSFPSSRTFTGTMVPTSNGGLALTGVPRFCSAGAPFTLTVFTSPQRGLELPEVSCELNLAAQIFRTGP